MTIFSEVQELTGVGVNRKDMGPMVKSAARLSDDNWDKLTEDAQLWVNSGVRAIKSKKSIPLPPDAKVARAELDDELEERPARARRAPEPELEPKEEPQQEIERPDDDDPEPEGEFEPEPELDPEPEPEPVIAKKKRRRAPPKLVDSKEAEDDSDKATVEDVSEGQKVGKKRRRRRSSRRGSGYFFIKYLLTNEFVSVEHALEQLAKQDIVLTPSSAAVLFYDVRAVLRVLKDLGMLSHTLVEDMSSQSEEAGTAPVDSTG